MDVDIRKYISQNFKEASIEEIKESIVSGLEAKEEITLPGLGVFFEILWKNSNDENKDYILNTIKNGL